MPDAKHQEEICLWGLLLTFIPKALTICEPKKMMMKVVAPMMLE
jgi:hypothetical protein